MASQEHGVSAKGTRLNRRGLQTRQTVIDVAIVELAAAHGGEQVSASLIAKRAGVTWGTVQHQFGDVDGLWAAVLEHVLHVWEPTPQPFDEPTTLEERITVIVERFWRALGFREGRAIENLRVMLPGDTATLERTHPATAAALSAWERRWAEANAQAFAGLDVDPVKLQRVQIFLPGAIRGMWSESALSQLVDMDEGIRGLIGAVVAYLS